MALLSTPWPLFNQPSIQLGALKAYLQSRLPGVGVVAHHFYLKLAVAIGYELYKRFSERTWVAESLYCALLYPERSEVIKRFYYRNAGNGRESRQIDFESLLVRIEAASNQFIQAQNWQGCGLAGFSISLCQLSSSLYFIREIKRRRPDLPIVIGGSVVCGKVPAETFKLFPQVDYLVLGEGELPLSALVSRLMDPAGSPDLPKIPGLIRRTEAERETCACFSQLEKMSELPRPDFDDYFQLLDSLQLEKRFFPSLPVEMSRGCWWKQTDASGQSRGCAFCNLNLQWQGYRSKQAGQVVSEIDLLTSKHKTLSVAFMDNSLPVKGGAEAFRQLAELNKDLRLFAEIRASTPKPMLEAMRDAGLTEVQIGIEALSSRLLAKMNKGTTAIQNLQIMKDCEELGVADVSNLIVYFPGSDAQDVEETLRCLDFALPFRPLRLVHFWLGLGSPVWENPKAFGLKAVFNHPSYSLLFPPDIAESTRFMIQAYRGNLGRQRKLWRPVKEKVRLWKKHYRKLHEGFYRSPILSYRDGREFMIISQRTVGGEVLTHRLTGSSRAIYLFCKAHQSLRSIVGRFPDLGEEKIVPFLRMMVDKKLMFEEENRYLSLAVSHRA
ncbi:MAG: RiPP maturation radical SAM C-methyltransferase [Desulforhabdus sp.]|nr:RiPP maturation radical SAM C-methyltransferase [Desulforhabdus sp.]